MAVLPTVESVRKLNNDIVKNVLGYDFAPIAIIGMCQRRRQRYEIVNEDCPTEPNFDKDCRNCRCVGQAALALALANATMD